MDDLIAFLNARLDEDEAAAMAATGTAWAWEATGDKDNSGAVGHVEDEDGRPLREVVAKRAILAHHAPIHPIGQWIGCQQCDGEQAQEWPCPDVLAVAAVYSDHPDYRPEWAVTAS
jgi:Family of unknown function (DUF6221)